MPAVDYVRIRKAVQYTGSNGAEVAAFAAIGIVSDNGSVLNLGDPVSGWIGWTLNAGDYFEDSDNRPWLQAEFSQRHITKDAALLDTNNNAAVAALNASQATQDTAIAAAASAASAASTAAGNAATAAAGKLGKVDLVSISVPILLLLGTADRAVVWNRPFSNTSYDLSYAFDASTIGRITCAPVAGTKTTTGITIRVTASLLAVSVLGVVHVLGIGA